MDVDDRAYYRKWRASLRGLDPSKLWRQFSSLEELPPLDFSNQVSAVHSANIEGNSIDLNSFLRGQTARFKAKEREEIEDLIGAYEFAQSHAPTERNLLTAHGMLASTLLPKRSLGKYRGQMVYVYSRAGMEYAALEPDYVSEKTRGMFAGIRVLKQSKLSAPEVFYHASLIHLVFVHIHPFMDGNGRAARLLEKWFLATNLGREAWHLPSEAYYKEHLAAYYKNIKIGLNYYTLNYDLCVPFLMMLPKSLKWAVLPR
ncbi:MAG TPA: Fic family protein [Pyrinomonadaceae bacterium]|jgi:Fic family protein|nr:Fic family protein [Pyrinomonadaceae bacterium]